MFDWLRRAFGAEPRPQVPATPLHGVEVRLQRDDQGMVSGFVVLVHNPHDGHLPDEALRQAINTLLAYAIQQDQERGQITQAEINRQLASIWRQCVKSP